jgi:putative ABC transport system permease protein
VSSWLTALRIARREARRYRGRAFLVAAMIAVPVAALAFAAVAYDTFQLSPQEKADRKMGAAQASISWPFDVPVHQLPDGTGFWPAAVTAEAPATEPTVERLLPLLPPGSRAIPDQTGSLTMRTAAGVGSLPARMLDYADPLARGIFRPLSGRAPATVDEVALTPAASDRLGAGVGDTVRLADGGRSFRVVGTVENPGDLRAETVVVHSGVTVSTDPQDMSWLVATPGPVTWAEVKQLNTHGLAVVSRHVLVHPPSDAEQYTDGGYDSGDAGLSIMVLVGGLAMLEIVLLAGPAFAVSARRRRRELALVAAAGGTPAHVRRIVLADGVVLGALAAAAGVALGVAVAAAGRPLFETYVAHQRSGSFRVYPVALAVLAGLAVATGVLAALVPAWISSRQDVVTALTGRRGITRSRRRWVVLGIALLGSGVAVSALGATGSSAMAILAGLAIGEFGLVLCTPALVGLVSRIGRWLPLAPRIALRDASRNRTAAAPAISAVMAAVVGSLAIAVVLVADDQRNHDNHQAAGPLGTVVLHTLGNGPKGARSDPAIPPGVVAALRSTMPVDQVHQVSVASCNGEGCFVSPRKPAARACPYAMLDRELTPSDQRAARRDSRCDDVQDHYRYLGGFGFPYPVTFIVEPDAAAALTDLPAGDADRVAAALRSGAVVVDDPSYLEDGRVTLVKDPGRPGSQTVTATGFAMPHRPQTPLAVMTPATARSLGFASEPLALVATTSRIPTTAEQDRLQAALGNGFWLYVERGPESMAVALLVLAVVAGVITLAAAAIATGLAADDGRADLAMLAAVGASPRVRRALSLSQSGVIAGLGSLLGTAAGLGASIAVLAALNRAYADVWPAPKPYPIAVPWLNVGVALLAVPAIAMLGAGLLTRSRLPIERRL